MKNLNVEKLSSINYRLKFVLFFDKRSPYFTINLRTELESTMGRKSGKDSSTSMPILTVNTNLFARLFCSFLLLRVSAGGEE